eukprot:SAG31_NODE_5052_length_2774_cov_1.392150_1_plen_192_part_10
MQLEQSIRKRLAARKAAAAEEAARAEAAMAELDRQEAAEAGKEILAVRLRYKGSVEGFGLDLANSESSGAVVVLDTAGAEPFASKGGIKPGMRIVRIGPIQLLQPTSTKGTVAGVGGMAALEAAIRRIVRPGTEIELGLSRPEPDGTVAALEHQVNRQSATVIQAHFRGWKGRLRSASQAQARTIARANAWA